MISATRASMRCLCAVVFLAAAVSACSEPESSHVTVDHNDRKLYPDQVVTLAPEAFACKAKFDLLTATQQYQKHEYSAWARTTSPDNGCFNAPPAGLSWTVYEIDYPAVSVGFASLAQYEAAKAANADIDPRGVYWVPSGFVHSKAAKQPVAAQP